MTRRDVLVLTVVTLLGVGSAAIARDVLHGGALLGAFVSAALAAAESAAFFRARLRTAAASALVAAAVVLLVHGAPSPWLDLGPFGAGPATEIAFFLHPFAQVLGVLVARRRPANEAILSSA